MIKKGDYLTKDIFTSKVHSVKDGTIRATKWVEDKKLIENDENVGLTLHTSSLDILDIKVKKVKKDTVEKKEK